MSQSRAIVEREATRDLPRLFSLPLIGDTLAFATDPAKLFAGHAQRLGPVFEVNLFGHPTACFVGPEAFALLLDDSNVVRAGANPPHVEAIFNSQSVPFLDGPARLRRKRLLMHAFREPALEGYLPIVEQVIDRYAAKWVELGSFAWVPELHALGFSVAGALFVGTDATRDDPDIRDAFAKVADGLLSIPLRLPFTRYGKALRARDFLLGIVTRAVDEHTRNPTGKNDVLARLLEAREGDDKLDREELCIETFHFFGAYSAVIGGLSFLASCLGRYPEVADRVRAEVANRANGAPLGVTSLRKLEYLDRVVKEVRRALPILPITFFGTIARDLSFQGVRIPAGHRAIGCIGATLLDQAMFPEPDRFDPERWHEPSAQQEQAWIPHGGGSHIDGHRCAGENLATLMLKVFAIRMLDKYRWDFAPNQDFSPTRGKLFATPVGGLVTRIQRRAG